MKSVDVFAVSLVTLLCVAACQPRDAKAPARDATPSSAPPSSAIDAPAELFDGEFAPYSNTALSITDTVTFSGDTLLFGVGHVYETTAASRLAGATPLAVAAGAGTAASLLGLPDTAVFELRRVSAELVNARAPNGGLCRPEATTFLLLGAEYAPGRGGGDLVIAGFQGVEAPGPTAAELKLCGVFRYGAFP